MAITVKHSGSPGVYGWAAFGAGQQAARKRAEEQEREVLVRQQAQDKELTFRHDEAQLGREHDVALTDLNFANRMAGQAAGLEAGQQAQRDMFDWQYTQEQRQKFDQLGASLERLDKSDEFSPEEKQEARRQIEGQMMGFQPQPRLKEQLPWPEEQGIGKTWSSPDGAFLLTRTARGEVQKLGEVDTGVPTYKDMASMYQLATAALSTEKGGLPSEKDVEKFVSKMIAMRKRLQSGLPADEDEDEDREDEDPWDDRYDVRLWDEWPEGARILTETGQ